MTAHKLQGRIKLYGFEISIENAKGSVRKWYDPHGKESGRTTMHFDYGYIRGTRGTDGDHVDVYVGPNTDSDRVFIVNQMKKPSGEIKKDGKAWSSFDEQKVMLAFKDADAAKSAYLKQYDDPRFFGGMKEMSVEDFKTKVLDKANHGQKIAEDTARMGRLLAELNLSRMATGEAIVTKLATREVLGETSPGVAVVPPITAYAQTTTSPSEKAEADREMKTAEGRRAWIADRIDDAGIAALAAPSVASYVGEKLEHAKNPRLKALGVGSLALAKKMKDNHLQEIGGLAAVAPGVTHTVAGAVDKMLGQKRASGDMCQYFMDHPEKHKEKRERDQKKMEKVAESLFEDFEYKTEAEKTAILNLLGRIGGMAARGANALGTAARGAAGAIGNAAGAAQAGGAGLMQRAQTALRGGFVQGATGASPGRVSAAQRMVQGAGKVPAVAAPGAVTAGGAVAPVASTAAAAGTPRLLNARNLVLGGGAAALGLGTYAGYKGVQTAANMLQNAHEAPLAPPGFIGAGRAF